MAKFIVLPIQIHATDTETIDYRVNVDYIARYWVHTTPGMVNVALRGTSSQGSTVVAVMSLSKLDSLIGL